MAIALSLDKAQLAGLAARQCNNFVPDGADIDARALQAAVPRALKRLETCFAAVDNKYFFDGDRSVFSHLHGDQYAMWLYFLANQLYRDGGDIAICSKLFLVNKAMFACDIFYEVALPDIFLLVHPVGTVLGRGSYSDYFVAYQRCGIGSNRDIYPRMGRNVTLRPGSAILGNCTIGNNVQVATESLVLDRDIADCSIYIGNPKTAIVKPMVNDYPVWRDMA
jgi:serine O-acetyltransferase